ncbi:MAG TPA: hypothetical protein VLA29_10025 [Acidimicrobiia bacterium]|nr:hypothetical protein [Acidimicrobiia bacterium]
MLLKRSTLDGIVAGDVDLAFRRWIRPTVRTGGSLRTRAGLLRIEKVEVIPISAITDEDARRAGTDLGDLLAFLHAKESGDVYRIELGPLDPDPRVALREDADLSESDIAALRSRLDRLDRASKRGAWTVQTLRLLGANPHVRAQDLADGLGLAKDAFKDDVRKLKALGLTISHSPGYELSPRGKTLLEYLDTDETPDH